MALKRKFTQASGNKRSQSRAKRDQYGRWSSTTRSVKSRRYIRSLKNHLQGRTRLKSKTLYAADGSLKGAGRRGSRASETRLKRKGK